MFFTLLIQPTAREYVETALAKLRRLVPVRVDFKSEDIHILGNSRTVLSWTGYVLFYAKGDYIAELTKEQGMPKGGYKKIDVHSTKSVDLVEGIHPKTPYGSLQVVALLSDRPFEVSSTENRKWTFGSGTKWRGKPVKEVQVWNVSPSRRLGSWFFHRKTGALAGFEYRSDLPASKFSKTQRNITSLEFVRQQTILFG